MVEEEKDVKSEDEETSSDTSADETSDEGKEPDSDDEAPGEPLKETEEESDEEKSDEEETTDDDEEPEAEPEEDPKDAVLAKNKEQIKNLNKALAEERAGKRKISEPEKASRTETTPTKGSDDLSKQIVQENERLALRTLYKEHSELAPENDPDNELFNKFQRGYKVLVEIDKKVPVTVEGILEKGREVMSNLSPSSPSKSNKKEQHKADMANLGSSSSGTKKSGGTSVSESDKRAAKAVGMSIEDYMSNKDTITGQDEVPI